MFGAVASRLGCVRVATQASMWTVPVRTIYPQMSSNHIAGMPRNWIPFREKVAAGLFISFCILATPAWVVTHIDNYRGGNDEYEIRFSKYTDKQS